MEELHTTLYFKEAGTDKVYQASLKPEGDLWVCNFAFGRRGSTLSTGTKTAVPVSYDLARKAYEKVVKEKKAKGYTEGEDGARYSQTDKEQRVAGVVPQLLNTIDEGALSQLLISRQYWMQEKMDGRRTMVRREIDGTVTGINKLGLTIALPDPIGDVVRTMRGSFLIDGEAIGNKLHVFDILEHDGRDLRTFPYWHRYDDLEHLFFTYDIKGSSSGVSLVPAYADVALKKKMFMKMKKEQKEGVVFKDQNAPYTAGRPNSGGPQLKFKFTATASFIVSEQHPTKRSVHLILLGHKGQEGNMVHHVGKVTIPPNHDIPKVDDIIEVRYLYAYPGGAVFQPVYLCNRSDVRREECTISQLKFKTSTDDDES